MFKPESNIIKRTAYYLLSFAKYFISKNNKLPNNPQKILVFRGGFLGDLITLTPALRLLKKNFPNSQIHLFTNPENEEYLKSCTFVDKCIMLKDFLELRNGLNILNFIRVVKTLRKNDYDIILEMSGQFRKQIYLLFLKYKYSVGIDELGKSIVLNRRVSTGRISQVDRYIKVVKELLMLYGKKSGECIDKSLFDISSNYDAVEVNKYLNEKNISEYIVIHPCASSKLRYWSDEKFSKLIEHIILEKKKHVILIGVKNERKYIERILTSLDPVVKEKVFNYAGTFSIGEIIALMKKANLFIGTDSGPMHLAKISGVKSIILFGPGDHIVWGCPDHTIIRKDLNCSPCSQFGFDFCLRRLSTRCAGLQMITVEDVLNRIDIEC